MEGEYPSKTLMLEWINFIIHPNQSDANNKTGLDKDNTVQIFFAINTGQANENNSYRWEKTRGRALPVKRRVVILQQGLHIL